MELPFNIEAEAGPARAGQIVTAHGPVDTPVFMPVGTQATVKGVPQDALEDLSAQIVLSNTYHLYLRPGHELIRGMGGLHRFMSWERAVLTDSGGFQVFSLGSRRVGKRQSTAKYAADAKEEPEEEKEFEKNLVRVTEEGAHFRSHVDGSSHLFTPERSMEIQIALGGDIIMAFDECTETPATRERTQQSMELTLRWARRSKDYFEAHKHEVPWAGQPGGKPNGKQGGLGQALPPPAGDDGTRPFFPRQQALFGIVQGGMFSDLRRESALRTVELDFSGYAIGGLSVGESREKTMEMIAAVLEVLPKDKPRYVMGVGFPEEITAYAAMGVDMMDCVLPTRAARHGLLFTAEGRLNIKNAGFSQDQGPIDSKCGCQVCARYSRAYLRHLFTAGEPLAGALNSIHNLWFYLDTMRAVRHAIRLGDISGIPAGSAPSNM
ncbi:MAG TPA: tRNA guanosine(34) transglycosylase Tgt [Candidatus Saccharimonadales bacterium]|nr:tRNA guanosine(34) transglycosylase Tgt [Candidatus Saccharimonadales bacterium]